MKNKGFTLIELLVVVAIIGILASVISVSLNSSRAKSRDSRRVSEIKEIQGAVEVFFQDNFFFPNSLNDVSYVFDGGTPNDPLGQSYGYEKLPNILNPNLPNGYCVGAKMENMSQASSPCSISGFNYTIKGP